MAQKATGQLWLQEHRAESMRSSCAPCPWHLPLSEGAALAQDCACLWRPLAAGGDAQPKGQWSLTQGRDQKYQPHILAASTAGPWQSCFCAPPGLLLPPANGSSFTLPLPLAGTPWQGGNLTDVLETL